MVFIPTVLSLALLPLSSLAQGPPPPPEPKDWETSPPYEWLFEDELNIPPVKEPKIVDGVHYYEVVVNEFQEQIYKDGRGPTTFVGYDAMFPGPTIKQTKDVDSVLRAINNSTGTAVVHLHGSYSRAPFDGWAEDLIGPNQFKDYYYPNQQTARTIWYHDHAMDHTTEHNFFGQVGQYHVVDEELDHQLGLPCAEFDIPLSISSHQFNEDGTLWSPDANNERRSIYGDVIFVNGRPWPKLTVQPRKYRFRLLDAAASRSFLLYLEETGMDGFYKSVRPRGGSARQTTTPPPTSPRIPFTVIASDSGYLSAPVEVSELYLSMAERYEIVIDFSAFAGKRLTMRNERGFANDLDYKHTDKIMQFHVLDGECEDKSSVPDQLVEINYPRPAGEKEGDGVERSFTFNGAPVVGWTINGVRFDDVENRVLAQPARGSVEKWVFINKSPAWSHPIHVHLVDFRVLSRTGTNRTVFPYESQGLKDVVWLAAGETVVVEAVFSPWEGVYMFHCHNLVHEDHSMMGAFNVTMLEGLGYEEGMHFVDPLDPTFAAKDYNIPDLPGRTGAFGDAEIESAITSLEGTGAYGNVGGVENSLEQFWAGKKSKRELSHSAKFRA